MDIAELDVFREIEAEELTDCANVDLRYDVNNYITYCNEITSNSKIILKIFHVNIRSVKKNFDMFLSSLEMFKMKDLDIIILSETRNIADVKYFTIPGFQTFSNGSMYNQNDGLLVFIRDGIDSNINHNVLPSSQVTLTCIDFNINNIRYSVMACYRSPSTNENNFLSDLETFLISRKWHNIDIFIGDINIDILETTKTATNNYISLLSYFGFRSYINSYTE